MEVGAGGRSFFGMKIGFLFCEVDKRLFSGCMCVFVLALNRTVAINIYAETLLLCSWVL